MASSKVQTAEELLSQFPPMVAAISEQVRSIVGAAVPTLSERVLPGWRAIGFRDSVAGHVCALFPLPDRVKVYFEYGASLDDPDHLLQGDTKQTRYLELRSLKDLRRRALTRLVRQAVMDRLQRSDTPLSQRRARSP